MSGGDVARRRRSRAGGGGDRLPYRQPMMLRTVWDALNSYYSSRVLSVGCTFGSGPSSIAQNALKASD